MKRIVVLCDGTWQKLDNVHPTNIAKLAASCAGEDDTGKTQLIWYHAGVGGGESTAPHLDKWFGGVFGAGLFNQVMEAYRFIALNWSAGTSLVLLGYSRGAYAVRSLAGLLRCSGVLAIEHISKLREASAIYQRRGKGHTADDKVATRFRQKYAAGAFETAGVEDCLIDYLGVFDTVGALGIPGNIFSGLSGQYRFHDMRLSRMVRSARHAVAIDERRRSFSPALWENLDHLRGAIEADYRQGWFPGDHGAVGGGGSETGLSDGALQWVIDGAMKAGLALSAKPDCPAANLQPDWKAPLESANLSLAHKVWRGPLGKARKGPVKDDCVHDSAMKRMAASAEELPERRLYRPDPLRWLSLIDTIDTDQ